MLKPLRANVHRATGAVIFIGVLALVVTWLVSKQRAEIPAALERDAQADVSTPAPPTLTPAIGPKASAPMPNPIEGLSTRPREHVPQPASQGARSATEVTGRFDCAKPRSQSALTICDDPELAAADTNYSDLYIRARATVHDLQAFETMRINAWRTRDACTSPECITDWYKTDTAGLARGIDNDGVAPPANETTADRIRRVRVAIDRYSSAKGETADDYLARLHSQPVEVTALLLAAEDLGAPFEDTLKSLDGFSSAMRDPERVKLVECILAHPSNPAAECQEISRRIEAQASGGRP